MSWLRDGTWSPTVLANIQLVLDCVYQGVPGEEAAAMSANFYRVNTTNAPIAGAVAVLDGFL